MELIVLYILYTTCLHAVIEYQHTMTCSFKDILIAETKMNRKVIDHIAKLDGEKPHML